MRALLMLAVLGACDPAFGVQVRLRDPASNRPIENATVAIACGAEARGYLGHTDREGRGFAGSIGSVFPPGCDIYIAKAGYRTQLIRYRDLCVATDGSCDRYFVFDMYLPPE